MTNFNLLSKFNNWLGELSSRMSLVGVSCDASGVRVAREAIEAHRRVSGGQSRSKCAAQVRKANIELLKAEWLKYAAAIMLVLTIGVGNVWGADVVQTYTLSTSDNGKSTSTGDVTWNIGSSAIAESSSKCKLTGTISFTLPSGATLKSVQLTGNGNGWGAGATITFKSGSTTLNTFSSCASFSLTTNKTDLSYSFTKSGTSSKNAWVASITVTYTPGATCSNKVTLTKVDQQNGSFNWT